MAGVQLRRHAFVATLLLTLSSSLAFAQDKPPTTPATTPPVVGKTKVSQYDSGEQKRSAEHLHVEPEPAAAAAAAAAGAGAGAEKKEKEQAWYDRIKFRGYTQFRYNRLGAEGRASNNQGDRALGPESGFSIRRARLIVNADPIWFIGLYLQMEFSSLIDEALHVGQVRDWWGDIFLSRDHAFRFRIGQQKVPYGWELMQSSSNRMPLDRTDGMNSAFTNERDIGGFFMFETPTARKRFRHLLDAGLKGSGDYGMTAVGFSNGQALNTRERNDNKHFFARVTYPFEIGSQILELAGGGYTGRYVVSKGEGIKGEKEILDARVHATAVLYPQPFGLQAEYNIGYGPELNPFTKTVEKRPLDGGYVMASYRQKLPLNMQVMPYVRVHRYDGGKKFETNAPRYIVREANIGVEWQIQKWLELTTELMLTDRTINQDRQEARLLRFQLQFTY